MNNKHLVSPSFTMQDPAVYRIRISGRLDASWSEMLSGMTVTTTGGRDTPETTMLEGRLLDQAALTGIINTLSDLHLPLLSVECLDCPQSTQPDIDTGVRGTSTK